MERYDAVIVGSGPAGLAAAINLTIRRKRFLLFGTERLSASVERSPKIENYLGFPSITGPELIARFQEHLGSMGIEVTKEQVISVFPMGDYFSIATGVNLYEATTVILATGVAPTDLFPGEEEFLGRGVSYCATCDAPLYKNRTVAVLGWSEQAAKEANFIAEIAETVYYLPVKRHDAPLKEGIITLKGPALAVLGEGKAQSLQTAEQTIPVDGVFILREVLPPSSLVQDMALAHGCPTVDSNMQTSIPGLFAAGDLTGKPHQLMRAAGQGQIAALAAVAYLGS